MSAARGNRSRLTGVAGMTKERGHHPSTGIEGNIRFLVIPIVPAGQLIEYQLPGEATEVTERVNEPIRTKTNKMRNRAQHQRANKEQNHHDPTIQKQVHQSLNFLTL